MLFRSQLFVQRAQAVQSNFGVTPRSAPVLVAICARLEGLPLAIELAAAWVRALGVEQILERLDDAFGLLVGGSRLGPGRQQTMRATLDWSHGLLAPSEQIVFRRLAVFVGGWSLEAAEVVCSRSAVASQEVLGLLTGLVDASLVQVDERTDGPALGCWSRSASTPKRSSKLRESWTPFDSCTLAISSPSRNGWRPTQPSGDLVARLLMPHLNKSGIICERPLVFGPGRCADGVPTRQSALDSVGRSRRPQRGPRVDDPAGSPP